MIFVILGIAVLVISFVIALGSLLREQQTFKEKAKVVKEDEAPAKEEKLSSKKSEVNSKTKSHQIAYDEESGLVDDRFPWEAPLKNFSPTQEQSRQDLEKEEEKANVGQKLGGEISIGDLIRKRRN